MYQYQSPFQVQPTNFWGMNPFVSQLFSGLFGGQDLQSIFQNWFSQQNPGAQGNTATQRQGTSETPRVVRQARKPQRPSAPPVTGPHVDPVSPRRTGRNPSKSGLVETGPKKPAVNANPFYASRPSRFRVFGSYR